MGSNNHQTIQKTDEDELDSGQFSESSSAFSPQAEMDSSLRIRNGLKSLPKIRTSISFDQKVSARFALELEEEIRRKTYSLHLRGRNIRLPDLITDLRKEFL